MSLDLYKPGETGNHHQHYNTRVITKLLRNYRSHPAILKLPNEMFYNSELIPCADVIDREKLCRLTIIHPCKERPDLDWAVKLQTSQPTFFVSLLESLVLKGNGYTFKTGNSCQIAFASLEIAFLFSRTIFKKSILC